MLGTKEKYVLAMATLFLIGLSAAWAGYSNVTTISGSPGNFASVQGTTLSLTKLKKNTWFNETYDATTSPIFTISDIGVKGMYIRIVLTNAPDLVDDFKSLTIKVYTNASTEPTEGFISLASGTADVLLYVDCTSVSTVGVGACIYGYTSPKPSSDVKIQLACFVEQAGEVK